MASAVSIVLTDAQATPVAHTFTPMGFDAKGVYWFDDQSKPTSLGYWRISLEILRPKPGAVGTTSDNRVSRVKITLHEPTLEVVGNTAAGYLAPPTISYINRAFTEYILPEKAVAQDRKDLRKMNWELQNNAQIIAAVEQLINVT